MSEAKRDSLKRVVGCPRCLERGKTWRGSDPKCAFAHGVFTPNNWNCATANDLRDLCRDEQVNNNEDQHACLLSGVDSLHVVLTWYKRRGCTEGAWMIDRDGHICPLTLKEAENIISANKEVSGER